MQGNPVEDIVKEKEIDRIKDVLTDEQQEVINNYLCKHHYSFWRFLSIFYHVGSRESEMMRIEPKHVDLVNQRVKILILKGTGYKEEWKPIHMSVVFLWQELLEEYALGTKSYSSFRNVNIPGGKQNDFFDLINDATRDIVDVTSTAAKTLNAGQFYTKLDNLATRVVDPSINNRILQIYLKEGQYSPSQITGLTNKLNTYIRDFNLQKTTFKITPIK